MSSSVKFNKTKALLISGCFRAIHPFNLKEAVLPDHPIALANRYCTENFSVVLPFHLLSSTSIISSPLLKFNNLN